MATQETIRELFQALTAAYPRNEVSQTTVELYARLLEDIDDELIKTAALDHISRSQWFPTIAELRAAVQRIALPELEPAAEAWGMVYSGMASHGQLWGYHFENPIIMRCIDALGWRRLCNSTHEAADRARFIELYNEYVRRNKEDTLTLPIVKQLANRLHPTLPDRVREYAINDPSAGALEVY